MHAADHDLRQHASSDDGGNLTVKRFTAVLTPVIVLAVLAAEAQAQPRRSSLSVASGRAAINGFVRETAHVIEEEGSFKLIKSEVSRCRKHGANVICLTRLFLPLETCSQHLLALPRRSIVVKERDEMTCTEHNNEALDGPPVPSSSTSGSSGSIEIHVTLRH